MKNISLLPPEIQLQKKARRKKQLIIVVSSAVLVVFLASYLGLLVMTASVNARVSSLEEERQDLESQVAQLDKYARMQDRAEDAQGTLRQALGEVPDWEGLLGDISRSMPAEVWIYHLNASFENGSGEISLQGQGYYYHVVASWFKEMEDIQGLKEVRYNYSAESIDKGRPVIHFELEGSIQPGEPLDRIMEGGVTGELAGH